VKFTESRFPISSIGFTETPSPTHPSIWQKLSPLWQSLLDQFKTEEQEFRVWSTRDRAGEVWWSAESRRTGKLIFEVTEDQIRSWIEKQQQC
jgi:hypothetical protein